MGNTSVKVNRKLEGLAKKVQSLWRKDDKLEGETEQVAS